MGFSISSRWGGGFLIASAVLFAVVQALMVGLEPPAGGAGLEAWVGSHFGPLVAVDECLVFAAVFLVPGLVGWAPRLAPNTGSLGAVFLGLAVPIWIVADLSLGRLIYPVFGMVPSPEVAALGLSLFYGALHMASLLVAGGAVFVSVATGVRRPIGVLGLAAAAGQLVGAYPWLLGPWGSLVAQLLFVVWLGWAGTLLLSSPKAAPGPSSAGFR